MCDSEIGGTDQTYCFVDLTHALQIEMKKSIYVDINLSITK